MTYGLSNKKTAEILKPLGEYSGVTIESYPCNISIDKGQGTSLCYKVSIPDHYIFIKLNRELVVFITITDDFVDKQSLEIIKDKKHILDKLNKFNQNLD